MSTPWNSLFFLDCPLISNHQARLYFLTSQPTVRTVQRFHLCVRYWPTCPSHTQKWKSLEEGNNFSFPLFHSPFAPAANHSTVLLPDRSSNDACWFEELGKVSKRLHCSFKTGFSCWFCLACLSLSLCALQVCLTGFLRRCHLLLWIYSLFQKRGKVNRKAETTFLQRKNWHSTNGPWRNIPLMCPVLSGIMPGPPCCAMMSSFWKTAIWK